MGEVRVAFAAASDAAADAAADEEDGAAVPAVADLVVVVVVWWWCMSIGKPPPSKWWSGNRWKWWAVDRPNPDDATTPVACWTICWRRWGCGCAGPPAEGEWWWWVAADRGELLHESCRRTLARLRAGGKGVGGGALDRFFTRPEHMCNRGAL